MEGVVVGRDARVAGSILGPGVRVTPGSRVENTVLAEGAPEPRT